MPWTWHDGFSILRTKWYGQQAGNTLDQDQQKKETSGFGVYGQQAGNLLQPSRPASWLKISHQSVRSQSTLKFFYSLPLSASGSTAYRFKKLDKLSHGRRSGHRLELAELAFALAFGASSTICWAALLRSFRFFSCRLRMSRRQRSLLRWCQLVTSNSDNSMKIWKSKLEAPPTKKQNKILTLWKVSYISHSVCGLLCFLPPSLTILSGWLASRRCSCACKDITSWPRRSTILPWPSPTGTAVTVGPIPISESS